MKFTLIAEKMLCGRIDTLEADLRKKQQKVDQLNAQIKYLMNLPGLGDCECCDGTGEVDDSAGGWGPAACTKSMCPDCEGTGVGVPQPYRRKSMNVIDEIAAERRRQVEAEGWTAEHDDEHADGSLAKVAACYAGHSAAYCNVRLDVGMDAYRATEPSMWPGSWARKWWKPKDPRRDLIRAAALIVAEIERLDRMETKEKQVRNPPDGNRPNSAGAP